MTFSQKLIAESTKKREIERLYMTDIKKITVSLIATSDRLIFVNLENWSYQILFLLIN